MQKLADEVDCTIVMPKHGRKRANLAELRTRELSPRWFSQWFIRLPLLTKATL